MEHQGVQGTQGSNGCLKMGYPMVPLNPIDLSLFSLFRKIMWGNFEIFLGVFPHVHLHARNPDEMR